MIFIILYVSLFFILASISLLDEQKDKFVKIGYIVLAVALVAMAALKPIGVDKDALNYLHYYYSGSPDFELEFTFLLIMDVAGKVFNTPQFMFIAYAFLSIPIKMAVLPKLTDLWFVSVLVWMSNYFILHDLTQIRAAAAVGVFLYSLVYLQRGERLKYMMTIVVACCFHMTAMVFFPLVFLRNRPLGRLWTRGLYLAPFIGYVMAALKLDFITLLPIPYVQERVEIYEEMRDLAQMGMDEVNIFNAVYLVKLLVYYLLMWKSSIITEHMPNFPLMIKIFALSLMSFTVFSFLPVIAFRTSEMFGIVEILLIPSLAYAVKPLNVGKILVLIFASAMLLLNIFYSELFNFTY